MLYLFSELRSLPMTVPELDAILFYGYLTCVVWGGAYILRKSIQTYLRLWPK